MKNRNSAREDMIRLETRRTLLERLKHPKDTGAWQGSWQEFHDRYWGLIFRFACSLGLREEDAKEVVQETVLCVAAKIGTYEYKPETARFSSWLGGIVYRKALKERAKGQRASRWIVEIQPGEEDDSRPLEQIADPASDVCARWQSEWEEHLRMLATEKVKQIVSDEQYQMFDSHVLQGNTADETAEILGTTTSAVYNAASRVRALIKEEVERLQKQGI